MGVAGYRNEIEAFSGIGESVAQRPVTVADTAMIVAGRRFW